MKKIFLMFTIVILSLIGQCKADSWGRRTYLNGMPVRSTTSTSTTLGIHSDGSIDVNTSISSTTIAVAATAIPFSISASSNTATLGRAANTSRIDFLAENEGAQDVYISTYAATSTSGLKRLSPSKSFNNGGVPYSGAWYFLTTAGQSPQIVGGIETSQ